MNNDEARQAYADSCTGSIAEYIEHATRFGAADANIHDAQACAVQVHITVTHALHVETVMEYRQGDQGSWKMPSMEAFNAAVGDQLREESMREDTIHELIRSVANQAYGAIAEATCVRTHPHTLDVVYTCTICNGKGRVTCGNCRGEGEIRCYSCGGSGRRACYSCSGSGRKDEAYQEWNSINRQYVRKTRSTTCFGCGGAGSINCGVCGGRRTVQCGTCHGGGTVQCQSCGGHGKLTRISSTKTYTIPTFQVSYEPGAPDYVRTALSAAGIPNIGKIGHAELDASHITGRYSAVFTYKASVNFCHLNVDIGEVSSTLILFGTPPQIFDGGAMLEVLVQVDCNNLLSAGKPGKLIMPSFPGHAGNIVKAFMESEIHRQIIDADVKGETPSSIAAQLGQLVTEAYVAQSLRGLRTVVRGMSNWSRIRWGFATVLLLILSVGFLTPLIFLTPSFRVPASVVKLQLLRSYDMPVLGILSIPIMIVGGAISRFTSRRWLKKMGGDSLLTWSARKKIHATSGISFLVIVLGMAAFIGFYNTYPLWVDARGYAYGVVPVTAPLQYEALPIPRSVDSLNAMPSRHQGTHKSNSRARRRSRR